jgi:antibiotic biosynthesis monooxygenase (ABM) superfamily enzyme
MPFNLDLKSIVVGMLLAYFVVPWVMGMFNRPKSAAPAV